MLVLNIQASELFDEETDRFIMIKPQTVKLEHSLVSISKWEAKWCKPFLDKSQKTRDEVLDYIRCMIINPLKDQDVVLGFTNKDINKVIDYINAPMTATTVTFFETQKSRRETITSELIYYWMISAGIPFECEKWHINRLFALIKICGAKNAPKKKGYNANYAKMQSDLNAKRRAMLNSKG